MVRIEITAVPSFRDVAGRFARANEQLLHIREQELRAEGPILAGMVKDRVSLKTGPGSTLQDAVNWTTEPSFAGIALHVTAPESAAAHAIYPRNTGALRFYSPKIGTTVVVPAGGGKASFYDKSGTFWSGKGYVMHPGGTLRPLFTPIMQDSLNNWLVSGGSTVLNRISVRYIQALS